MRLTIETFTVSYTQALRMVRDAYEQSPKQAPAAPTRSAPYAGKFVLLEPGDGGLPNPAPAAREGEESRPRPLT